MIAVVFDRRLFRVAFLAITLACSAGEAHVTRIVPDSQILDSRSLGHVVGNE